MKFIHVYLSIFLVILFCNSNDPVNGLGEPEVMDIENEPLISSDNVDLTTDNEDIDADTGFSTPHTTDDPRPCFQFDLNYTKSDVWNAHAELTKNNDIFSPGIQGVIISVNSQPLTEDTFFTGTYTGTFQSLTSGETVTVTLSFTDSNTYTFTATLPPDFTRSPNLTATKTEKVINFIWESVSCSAYQLFKKIENGEGTKAVCTIPAEHDITDTIYETTMSSLLTGNISMSPAPRYFTFWVCPSNKISLSSEFSSDSYIQLAGKASNGITNKPKQ